MKFTAKLLFSTGIFCFLLASCSNDDSPTETEQENTSQLTITTKPVTAISQTHAESGGEIIDGENETIVATGVVWSTNSTPTLDDNFTVDIATAPGYSSFMEGLELTTVYFVRAYVTTQNETIYGNEVSFTTLDHKVFNGVITFNSQSIIEEFFNEGFSKIKGGFTIEESVPGNITSLQPFENLLEFDDSNLNDDANSVSILNNQALTSLSGLENINILTSGIGISNNASLENLEGLNNLSSVNRFLVANNEKLTDILAVSNLTATGFFLIGKNDVLTTLNGLENLVQVNENLRVLENPVLTDLCALETLIFANGIEGSYMVADNAYNPTQQDLLDGNCSL